MASAQDWGSAAYPPPPPPTTVIVPNPYLQPQYAAATVPPFPPQHYPPSQTSVYIGPGVTGGSSIDHAFARSGRDLSLSAGVFLLITCALAIVGVVSPWVSGPVTVNGVLQPIQDCSLSIGLIYIGYYGDKCASDRTPKYGTVTIAAYTGGSRFGGIVAGTGQFAAAALSLGVILASVATAAGFVACKRYSKSSLEPVTPKHFGTAAVLVGLSATIFTMCVVGVVVGDLWLGANPFNYFDGGGRLAADAAIGTSLIAMVLSIVLKFKTRGVAKSSAPEL
jgi:hypothetical protein